MLAELRFQAGADLSLRPFLPHWNAPPHCEQAKVIALRDVLAHAYQSALNRSYDLSRIAPQSADTSGMLDLAGAMVAGICAAVEDSPRDRDQHRKIAVFLGDIAELAETTAATLRRSRFPAISAFDTGDQRSLVVVHASDDSEAGATLDGLRARVKDLAVLAPVEMASGVIWLRDDGTIPESRRGETSAIVAILRSLGVLADDQALAVLRRQDDELCFAGIPAVLAGTPADELSADISFETALRVRPIRAVRSDEALRALQERIVEARFPVGYRVSLEPVRESGGNEADIELLREEIAEREAEIELIRALAAPQMRLLRFSDAQLPALVDGLRRMPPEMFRNADLRYAAGHAAGRAEPAHFLLYDPGEVSLEGRLPEHYWRGRTEDRPIRYWLDPHAARAMQESGGRTFVFTPVRQRLLPAIDSFGGTLDQTLRLILGNLFADASEVLAAEGAEPVFLFSPPSVPGADMDLELLDRRWFQPVSLSLRWLNDYMMVRSPRIADRAVLSQLAEELYEGEVAARLRREAQEVREALEREWSASEARLRDQIGEVVSHVGEEIQRCAERLSLGRQFLIEAQDRIAEQDRSIELARARLAEADSIDAEMRTLATDLSQDRYSMVSDILSEIELGDRAMKEAERRIAIQLEKIEDLVQRLRYQ